MFIKYQFNEEFVEVNVKKRGQPSQQNPLGKKYSGLLLINAAKLKDIHEHHLYIPPVNHPFYKS
jgi:hypothetical protein